jgi:hypothetical protein
MTRFYMDDDMNIIKAPATKDDLCGWANEYDLAYFDGLMAKQEPGVDIAIVDDVGGTAGFGPENRILYFEKAIVGSEKFCRIAMLHELIHIKLFATTGDADENHGLAFKTERKRLWDAGAYEDLL